MRSGEGGRGKKIQTLCYRELHTDWLARAHLHKSENVLAQTRHAISLSALFTMQGHPRGAGNPLAQENIQSFSPWGKKREELRLKLVLPPGGKNHTIFRISFPFRRSIKTVSQRKKYRNIKINPQINKPREASRRHSAVLQRTGKFIFFPDIGNRKFASSLNPTIIPCPVPISPRHHFSQYGISSPFLAMRLRKPS